MKNWISHSKYGSNTHTLHTDGRRIYYYNSAKHFTCILHTYIKSLGGAVDVTNECQEQ